MKLTFLKTNPNRDDYNLVQINDAQIRFPHFSGKKDEFHSEGERDFKLVIPDQETADEFVRNGWNVTVNEKGDNVYMNLKIKINWDRRYPPEVYLVTNGHMTKLDKESSECIDYARIIKVDCDISAYDWGPINGKSGRTAYLDGIKVYQQASRFAEEYAEEESPEELPF